MVGRGVEVGRVEGLLPVSLVSADLVFTALKCVVVAPALLLCSLFR